MWSLSLFILVMGTYCSVGYKVKDVNFGKVDKGKEEMELKMKEKETDDEGGVKSQEPTHILRAQHLIPGDATSPRAFQVIRVAPNATSSHASTEDYNDPQWVASLAAARTAPRPPVMAARKSTWGFVIKEIMAMPLEKVGDTAEFTDTETEDEEGHDGGDEGIAKIDYSVYYSD